MPFFKRNKAIYILLLVFQLAFSQNYFSKNYSTADGLPNNSIYSVFKDSRGVLWIGTENGVSAIKNGVIHNYNQADGFAYNNCWSIVEDKNHNLWFGSFGGGLTYYDGKQFKVINTKKGLVNDKVRKLFVNNNTLYVGTVNGLTTIDITTFNITNYCENSKVGKFQVMDFFEFKSNMYFGTNIDGIWKIDSKSKKIKFITYDYPIFSIYKDKDSIIIGKGSLKKDGINKISLNDFYNNKKSDYYFGYGVYWAFAKDKRNTIYGVSNAINYSIGGLYKLEGKKAISLNELYGIQSTQAWSLFYDKINDILYVGTLDKGLYEVHLNNEIQYFSPEYFKIDKIEINVIDKIEDKTCLLTNKGLYLIKADKINNYTSINDFFNFANNCHSKSVNLFEFPLYKEFHKRKINELELRILKKYDNSLWVSSTIGLFKLNNNGKITEYYPIFTGVFDFNNNKNLIYQEPYRTICSLSDYQRNSLSIPFPIANKNNPTDVFQIISTNYNTYYLSRYSGLFSFVNGKFSSYYHNGIWNEKELLKATLNEKGNLIIANTFGDIFIVDDRGKFKIIKKISKHNIIGNTISFLSTYKDFLLIGTEKGLNIYKDDEVRLIDGEQGLNTKNINCGYVDGVNLLIGSSNGLFKVDLKKILFPKKRNNNIDVSDIQINSEKIKSNNFNWFKYKSSKLQLKYYQNNISIDLSPNGFQYTNKLLYSYKLLGISKSNWSEWSNLSKINFPYLPDGEYQLMVKVKDLSNGNLKEFKVLTIKITPPFWKTWWFLSYCLLTIVLFAFIIYKRRIEYVTKKEQEKGAIQKRLAETKMEALQSQMNPHFIFNAMNSIQHFIIDNDTDEALMYMGEFSKLIRQTLDHSSKQRICLEDEILYLKTYIHLENMRFKDAINFKLDVSNSLDTYEVTIPSMLIQPFVENVFVHAFDSTSKNPTLEIAFTKSDNLLLCEIKDNGKGMMENSLNKLYTSKGIKLVEERIKLIQKNNSDPVLIKSTQGKGTTVLLIIQLV